MGMTIEEHIVQLKKLKSFHNGSYGASVNFAIETMRKYEYDHKKIEKIAAILKTAKADPNRDEYAEYYLDAIEEVIRWTLI